MRKLAVLSILVLGLIASGATPALASGPYCLHLTNFCDTITLNIDAVGNAYGTWDWTCDHVTLASVLGRAQPGPRLVNLGTRPVDANGIPFTYTTNFTFAQSNQLFNLWGTDGTTTVVFQLSQPSTLSAGACSLAGGNSGLKPSLGSLQ
jgi:hypothetical protein